MKQLIRNAIALLTLCLLPLAASAADKRLVVIDQDGSGPGGSNMWSMLALLQAPDVQVLGISMVTGNAWMERETAHTLRMLELIGRRDVPVYRGATWPLVRDMQDTVEMQKYFGKVAWLGAWGGRMDDPDHVMDPFFVPDIPEGKPTIKPAAEDAAHFLVRTVHEHPHQVTIYAAGPLTNLALAQRIDPEFASLAKELVFMGGSLTPVTEDDEFTTNPTHEFNLWFDPEAAHIVLTAAWKKITMTTVDISIKTFFTPEILGAIAKSDSPAARYIAKYDQDRYYMWDEVAALGWLYPDIITKSRDLYVDVDLSRGPSYGNTLAWTEKLKPERTGVLVQAQLNLDRASFEKHFIDLMSAPTPGSKKPAIKD